MGVPLLMNKTNWILLVILIVQVGIIVLVDRPWSSGRFDSGGAAAMDHPVFPYFDPSLVQAIEIIQGERSMRLEQSSTNENGWEVRFNAGPTFPADPFKAGALLDSVRRMDRSEVASRSTDKKPVFGLGEDSALDLIMKNVDDRVLARLFVGRSPGAMQGTYVCLPDEEEIYLVRENIRRACVGDGNEWTAFWRDETVFSMDSDTVVWLKIKNPEGVFSAEIISDRAGIENKTWRVIDGDPALADESAQRILAMLAVLSSIRAQETAPKGTPLDKVGLDDPEIVIEVQQHRSDAPVRVLSISREDGGSRYLMMDKDELRLFRVNSFSFHVFLKPLR